MANAGNRLKQKGRKEGPNFVKLISPMLKTNAWGGLSPWAVKLYIEIAMQYNGRNNGDLSATFSQLKDRGWHSKSTLSTAIKELIAKGFIIRTRLGGNNTCNLYALTCFGIDECKGKLDISPNVVPLNSWKNAV